METISEIAIKIFIEVILISGILGFYFSKREERMKKTIEEEFKKRDKFYDIRFSFKMRALEELLAPIKLQLMRNKITLKGYVFTYNFPHNAENAFVEKYNAYRKELEIEGSLD